MAQEIIDEALKSEDSELTLMQRLTDPAHTKLSDEKKNKINKISLHKYEKELIDADFKGKMLIQAMDHNKINFAIWLIKNGADLHVRYSNEVTGLNNISAKELAIRDNRKEVLQVLDSQEKLNKQAKYPFTDKVVIRERSDSLAANFGERLSYVAQVIQRINSIDSTAQKK